MVIFGHVFVSIEVEFTALRIPSHFDQESGEALDEDSYSYGIIDVIKVKDSIISYYLNISEPIHES